MADTPRTRAALQALFPDNTGGDISPQDQRDFLVSALGGYGGLYVQGGVTAQATTTSFAKLTAFAADMVADDTTPAHATDDITILTDGVYEVTFNLSFSGTGTAIFEAAVGVDGVEQVVIEAIRKMGATGDVGSMGAGGLLSLTAAEVVTVLIKSDGTDSLTVQDAQLRVKRVL